MAAAVGIGMAGAKFLGPEHGRRLMAGAFAAPIEAFVRDAAKSSPTAKKLVTDALGDAGSYNTMAAFPDYAPVTVVEPPAPGYLGSGDTVGEYSAGSYAPYYS